MFAVVYAVVRRIRLIEGFFKTRIACPLEFATVDNGTANRCAVAADVFCQRLDNNVGSVFYRAEQCRRSNGVVYHQWQPLSVRGLCECWNINDIDGGIADRFAIHQFGAAVGIGSNFFGFGRIDKAYFYALARQAVGKEIVSAAVERFGCDDVVACFNQGLNGIGNCRHTAGDSQCGDTAFQTGNAFFQNGSGRIHHTGVDIARYIKVEQVCAVLRVVESVGSGLVNGDSSGFGSWFGLIACMQSNGFPFHLNILVAMK